MIMHELHKRVDYVNCIAKKLEKRKKRKKPHKSFYQQVYNYDEQATRQYNFD